MSKVYRKKELPILIEGLKGGVVVQSEANVDAPAFPASIVNTTQTLYEPHVDAQSEGGKAKARNHPWPKERIQSEFARYENEKGRQPSYRDFIRWLARQSIMPPGRTAFYEHTKDQRDR